MSIQECGHFRRHHHKTIRRTRENGGPSKRMPETRSLEFVTYGKISTIHYPDSHKVREQTGRSKVKKTIFQGYPVVKVIPIGRKP